MIQKFYSNSLFFRYIVQLMRARYQPSWWWNQKIMMRWFQILIRSIAWVGKIPDLSTSIRTIELTAEIRDQT